MEKETREELLDSETKDVGELITTLKDDVKKIKKLKKENKVLRDQVEGLLQNNDKFTALVESLDDKLKMSAVLPRRFQYNFMDGSWKPSGSLKKHKIELGKKKVDIQNINSQLEEIIRLLMKSKK